MNPNRVDRVMAALARLRALDPAPPSQGLSPEGARLALDAALDAITPEGLEKERSTPGQRPACVALIAAWGVFTSPLEWVALLAAAGVAVRLKPPSRDPAFCQALARVFAAEGLDVTLLPDRALPPEARVVLAFGSDQTMATLRERWPDRRLVQHGHRFSLALAADPATASALARDLTLYDTRGCMAPVCVLVPGEPAPLARALAAALEETEHLCPRGPLEPELGPLWRERAGLARVRGAAIEGPGWAVLTLPAQHLLPVALPRMAVLHPIPSLEAASELLLPWRAQLSTLGAAWCASEGQTAALPAWAGWFPRVCPLGAMQTPPFPRLHDGSPMLGSLLL